MEIVINKGGVQAKACTTTTGGKKPRGCSGRELEEEGGVEARVRVIEQ